MSKSIAQMLAEQTSPEYMQFVEQMKKEEAAYQAEQQAKRDSMNQSVYKGHGVTQITLRHPEFTGYVVMTQYDGTKTWAVVGHDSKHLHGDTHRCHNGNKTQFNKKNGLMMAYEYLESGRTQF